MILKGFMDTETIIIGNIGKMNNKTLRTSKQLTITLMNNHWEEKTQIKEVSRLLCLL